MKGIEVIIGLLVVVTALAWLASRLKLPYPILLVLGGLALGFVPGLPRHELDLRPDLVFLFFLPPLLYYAGLLTTWRDFKANLRPISLLAVGLVLFTTFLVAAAAHWMIPEMGWPAAFVLGAIVSPPDAVAATAILQRLRIPRRIIVILEGESLVNDATALVAYRFSLLAVAGEFAVANAGWRFLFVAAGGVIVGYLAGVLVAWVRPRVHDPAVESAISLLTPFVAYLPAEWLHVSGVLAVVTTGIYLSRVLPRIVAPRARLRAYATWEVVVFLLNGLIFILIGLQLPLVLQALSGMGLWRLIGYAAAVSVVCIVVRMLWVFPATYVPRLLVPSFGRRDPAPPRREVFVIAWTGVRGIVSLAAALALPLTMPQRDLIIFITFGVILVTLVGQGLTLAPLIRALRLTADRDEQDEEVMARYLGALAAIEHLDRLTAAAAAGDGAGDGPGAGLTKSTTPTLALLRATYDERIAYYSRQLADLATPVTADVSTAAMSGGDGPAEACATNEQVIRQALAAERRMVIKLRDDGVISDEVLRRVQEELDLEESKISD